MSTKHLLASRSLVVPDTQGVIGTTSDEFLAVLRYVNMANAHAVTHEFLVNSDISVVNTNFLNIGLIRTHPEFGSIFTQWITLDKVNSICGRNFHVLSLFNWYIIELRHLRGFPSINKCRQSLMMPNAFLSVQRINVDFTFHGRAHNLSITVKEITGHDTMLRIRKSHNWLT